jgi:hypothetical protein
MTFHSRAYGRFFAVYDDEELVAVCVYRVGAEAVKGRLEKLEELLRSLTTTNRPRPGSDTPDSTPNREL